MYMTCAYKIKVANMYSYTHIYACMGNQNIYVQREPSQALLFILFMLFINTHTLKQDVKKSKGIYNVNT